MANLKPRELATVLYRLTADLDGKPAEEMVAKFVAAIRSKGLGARLAEVLSEYEDVHNRESGRKVVLIDSAHEVSDSDVKSILSALGLSSKEAEVRKRTVPELIGGLRAKTEDKVIDVSVRRRLADLRRSLATDLAE